MSWNLPSTSQATCSFSSPASEDVKPNIHLLPQSQSSNSTTLPLHSVDVKQPPPGFSQSCNHKILLSKSFDCKTGTTQVANLPNVSNQSNSIRVNPPQTPNGLPNNFNCPPPSRANLFQSSCQRLPGESDSSFYQRSFSHNIVKPLLPPTQVLKNGQTYASTPAGSSTNQVNGLTTPFPHTWQQPPPLFNPTQPPAQSSTSFRTQTNYDPPLLLPPLNQPPPNFIQNTPSSSSTSHIQQFDSRLPPKIQINGNSERASQNTSNGIHPTIKPRNFLSNGHQSYTSNNAFNTLAQENSSNFVPGSASSSFPISFNIPPPSFIVPPPPTPHYPPNPTPPVPHIKSEIPNSCCIENSLIAVRNEYSTAMYNDNRNMLPTLKRPRSRERQSCDHPTNNQYSDSPRVGTPSSDNRTNGYHTRPTNHNNSSSSYQTHSKSPSTNSARTNHFMRPDSRSNSNRRSPSTTKASGTSYRSDNTKTSRSRRSRSPTRHSTNRSRCSSRSKDSHNRSEDSHSRSKNSHNRSEDSHSRSKDSHSRSKDSHSRPKDSHSRSKDSHSRPKDSLSRSEDSQSRYKDSQSRSKRSRSRSKSRQQQSQSKRVCTRTRRSRSRSPQRASRTRRSASRSRNEPRSSRNQNSRSLRDRRSRSRSSSRAKTGASADQEEALSKLDKWRMNNCCSEREMTEKFNALAAMEADQIIEQEKKIWTRSAPADLYYTRRVGDEAYECTQKERTIHDQFQSVVQTIVTARASKTPFDYTANRKKIKSKCSHCASHGNVSSDSESGGSSSEEEEDNWMLELQLKQNHPDRLHPELWFNDKGEMNDGPVCRCSTKSRRSGIRHNIYAGEDQQAFCNPDTNNPDKLYHYRVTVSPPTNFLINKPTVIEHDNQEFIFEGFSLFSHHPLEKLPTCRVIRFNIQYTIVYIEEKVPSGFSVRDTEVFFNYLFHEVLELVDLDLKSVNDKDGCPQFHIMPRFVRELKENGKELLPMYRVLEYFTTSFEPVISEDLAKTKGDLSTFEWQDFADGVKGMIIVKPGAKPCAMRVDQLDRESETNDIYPDAVHFGSRPLQLCFAGSPDFQKLWKGYVKLRHLIANKPKRTAEDKRRLAAKEQRLQEMRTNSKMKRGVTVAISSRGFFRTGIMCDMVQHAMLIPVLICHLRFHRSLNVLEDKIEYKFKNRYLLQLALTHPSYRENFGTNPDHARNSLSNCGVRQPEYGDRRIHFQNTRKRGINTLINIMSKLGRKVATESNITHNERLEFLGDAVVEFITSIHLFHVFSDIEEGGLATYRAAIVQNQHLAHLAKKIGLEAFMLYAHGSDLCHEVELKHAMANCFEALMGALFLDGGIHVADQVFSSVLYKDNEVRYNQWMNYPQHPLQEQEPDGDRQWVKQSPLLKKLQYLEFSSGVIFNHIRLLARVFTTRSMGYTNLTMGSNQRLEFLGDTVLQLITSDYLYNHFPEHHEGHLSLLRSSLVNNRTQSVVCNDICMPFFANLINSKIDLKMKDRADLLEAFLGAMYIDKGMKACEQFCKVCFFPRLQYFILNQEWNDPKSKLQQCCLTLRTLDGGEPDIPIYKVIEHVGPTNSRSYTVAVYFKNERLAKATGSSIQQAEMNAAKVALHKCPSICPQLDHQKRVIAKSLEIQKYEGLLTDTKRTDT